MQRPLRVNRLAAESEANSSSDKYSSLFATFSLEETRIVYIIQLAFDSTCLNSIWKLERQSQTRAWEVEKTFVYFTVLQGYRFLNIQCVCIRLHHSMLIRYILSKYHFKFIHI